MIVNKDQYLNKLVYVATSELNLSVNQSMELMKIVVNMFNDCEFLTNKNEVSVERCPNEVILKNFLGCKKLGGAKDSTLKCYMQTYSTFMNFKNMSLLDVKLNDIRRFLLDYESRNSKKTTDNARRNLNCLFQFMEDEGYILKNPCKTIKKIKDDIKVKKFNTNLEMESMRDACNDQRELALIDLLLATGIRVGEVSRIKIADINWNERSILITGKGNKQRIVIMSQRCKKHLQEYLIGRKGNSEYLFCSLRKPYNGLSINGIEKIVHSIGSRCDMPEITVHCFRRWLASDMFKKGIDMKIIQEFLGHSSMQTTAEYYINNEQDRMKYVYDTFAS